MTKPTCWIFLTSDLNCHCQIIKICWNCHKFDIMDLILFLDTRTLMTKQTWWLMMTLTFDWPWPSMSDIKFELYLYKKMMFSRSILYHNILPVMKCLTLGIRKSLVSPGATLVHQQGVDLPLLGCWLLLFSTKENTSLFCWRSVFPLFHFKQNATRFAPKMLLFLFCSSFFHFCCPVRLSKILLIKYYSFTWIICCILAFSAV
jgi:hypothetical protein